MGAQEGVIGPVLTVTKTEAISVHVAEVPVTVYTIVDVGLALGLAQLVQLNAVEGLQV